MTDHVEKATELFMSGCNCSQAVAGAFADTVGLDEKTMLRFSSAFGGGFARTRNICGAVSGMGMILGLKYYSHDDKNGKRDIYAMTQSLTEEFRKENGSIICADLMANIKNITCVPEPDERTAEYYKSRPCLKLVRSAAEMLDEYLKSKD